MSAAASDGGIEASASRLSLCLDHLSLYEVSALDLIEIAARLECGAVSLFVRPLPLGPYKDLVCDAAARADVARALRDTGLSVGVVEPFMLDERIDWELMERSVALAAELDGTVNLLCFDEEPARLQASLGRLTELARAAGVRVAVEGFTLSSIKTPAEALALAESVGCIAGLNVDTLHVIRAGGSWADVAALPPERIAHVQLSDGPCVAPFDLQREATVARLPPGAGEFDLASLVPLLPTSARLAVEAPFVSPPGMTPLDRARVVIDAANALLGGQQHS